MSVKVTREELIRRAATCLGWPVLGSDDHGPTGELVDDPTWLLSPRGAFHLMANMRGTGWRHGHHIVKSDAGNEFIYFHFEQDEPYYRFVVAENLGFSEAVVLAFVEAVSGVRLATAGSLILATGNPEPVLSIHQPPFPQREDVPPW